LDGTFFGTSGTSGVDGTSGTSGSSGSDGTNGTSGTSGRDGTYFGSSGTSGTSGTTGTSGVSGSNGTSGSSGFLNLIGTTDNGVITYLPNGSGSVEQNLLFDAGLNKLIVTGSVAPTVYNETISSLGTGGSVTLNLVNANNFTRTVNSNTTFTFSNAPTLRAFGFTMALTNAGAYVITWPTSVKWANASAPLLTSAGTDVLTFYTYDGGVTYYGFLIGLNLS
jgi:hypothetical protein